MRQNISIMVVATHENGDETVRKIPVNYSSPPRSRSFVQEDNNAAALELFADTLVKIIYESHGKGDS